MVEPAEIGARGGVGRELAFGPVDIRESGEDRDAVGQGGDRRRRHGRGLCHCRDVVGMAVKIRGAGDIPSRLAGTVLRDATRTRIFVDEYPEAR